MLPILCKIFSEKRHRASFLRLRVYFIPISGSILDGLVYIIFKIAMKDATFRRVEFCPNSRHYIEYSDDSYNGKIQLFKMLCLSWQFWIHVSLYYGKKSTHATHLKFPQISRPPFQIVSSRPWKTKHSIEILYPSMHRICNPPLESKSYTPGALHRMGLH